MRGTHLRCTHFRVKISKHTFLSIIHVKGNPEHAKSSNWTEIVVLFCRFCDRLSLAVFCFVFFLREIPIFATISTDDENRYGILMKNWKKSVRSKLGWHI